MVGVYFTLQPDRSIQPYLWRQLLPTELTTRLVTDANPSGDITISDLELAATVVHHGGIAHYIDIREGTTNNLHDNTLAVYWQQKVSTTTTKAAAYILCLQAIIQLTHQYVPRHEYLPGGMNTMADDCSRLHSQVLAHFHYLYPQPNSWRFCSLNPEMISEIASALSKMRSDLVLFLHAPVQPNNIGNVWSHFATSTISAHSYLTCQTRSQSSKFL
jgi:hypothetical protein